MAFVEVSDCTVGVIDWAYVYKLRSVTPTIGPFLKEMEKLSWGKEAGFGV